MRRCAVERCKTLYADLEPQQQANNLDQLERRHARNRKPTMQCLSMQCLSMHSLSMCMHWLQLTCLTPGIHPAAAEIRTWEQTNCHNWSAIVYCRKRRTTDNVMHINRRHRSDTQATTVLHTLVRQCQSINESYLLLHALGQLACFWVSD